MPRRPVKQGASKKQNRSRKRAEKEVLHRSLDRTRAGATVSDEGVGPKGHRLEAEEDTQQVDSAREHHRAERREQDQHVELATLEAMLPEVSAG